jgi:hypothetical protein
MESTNIDLLRKQVKAALYDLNNQLNDRKYSLADALLYARFVSDIAEVCDHKPIRLSENIFTV